MSRVVIGLVAVCALGLAAGARPATPSSPLDLLEGAWSGTIAGVSSAKQPAQVTYTAATGGVVLGTTKVLDLRGRAVYFEFERFQAKGPGATLFPYPGGKAATPFALERATATSLVFSNPKKDWPRRLVYTRTGDRLVITASQPGTRMLRLDLRKR